jgi:hypothetical protein
MSSKDLILLSLHKSTPLGKNEIKDKDILKLIENPLVRRQTFIHLKLKANELKAETVNSKSQE